MASKKYLTLRKSSDFTNLITQGRSVRASPWLKINFLVNNLHCWRVGYTIPRKVGNAVLRNKIKRWSREILKTIDLPESKTNDVNFKFNPMMGGFYKNLAYEEFKAVFLRGIQRVTKNSYTA